MPTLSPPPHMQSSAEHSPAGDAPGGSLVAIVHKQLAALESLAAEGYAEATQLHTEIADLSHRLNTATARLARLEGTLASTERVLAAIRAGLLLMPSQQPQVAQAAAPQPATNGADYVEQLAVSTPAPVTSTPTPQPDRPSTSPAAVSPENMPAVPVAAAMSVAPTPRPERVAPPTPAVQQEPERVATSVPPTVVPATTAARPQLTSVPTPTTPVSSKPAAQQAPPIEPSASDNRLRIQRGSTVEVVFDDDTTEIITIVRQSEANPSRNLIGENTPLGQVLLGARVGDICRYRVGNNPEATVRVGAIA